MKKRDAIFLHVASGIAVGAFAALTLNQCTSCTKQNTEKDDADSVKNKTEVVVPSMTQIVVVNPAPVKPAKPQPVKPQPVPVADTAKVVVKGGDNVIVAGDNNNVTINKVVAPDTVKKAEPIIIECKRRHIVYEYVCVDKQR